MTSARGAVDSSAAEAAVQGKAERDAPERPRAVGKRARRRFPWRSLNPFAALFGPTFQKEVRVAGRKRGTYIARFMYAAGLLAVAAIAFVAFRRSVAWRSPVEHLQALQEFAPILATTAIWFQFIVISLAAPLMAAPAICDERRGRTLGALLTTPLTAGEIVGGKLTSRILQLIVLALLSTPLLLAIRVFGGLDAQVVLRAAGITVSAALLGASLAVLFSVWHRRAASAALFAIFAATFLQLAPLVATSLVAYYTDLPSAWSTRLIAAASLTCSPVVLAGVTSGATGIPPLAGLGQQWLFNVAYNLLVAFAAGLVASVALRRVMLREAASEGPAVASTAAEAPPDEAPGRRLRARRERTVSDRPVLWREVRQATIASRPMRYGVAAVTVGGLSLLYWLAGMHDEGLHGSLAVLGVAAAMLTSIFLTTGGISGEREARTWEVLLTTPLTPGEILTGKYLGSLRRQWLIPTIVLAHFLIAAAVGAVSIAFVPKLLLIISGPVLLLSATGLLFSLLFRRGIAAAICNLTLGLMLWIGVWILGGLIQLIIDLDRVGASWVEPEHLFYPCFVVNPVAMVVAAIQGDVMGWRLAGDTIYEILDDKWSTAAFNTILISVWCGYALFAAAALWLAHTLFPRVAGRTHSADEQRRGALSLIMPMFFAAIAVAVAGLLGWSLAGPLGAMLGTGAVAGLFGLMRWLDRRAERTA